MESNAPWQEIETMHNAPLAELRENSCMNAGPKLHFITGKGGVGKSTFALALCEKLAKAGRKTLLVDLANSELFKEEFDTRELTYEPMQVRENLYVSYWQGSDCLREYIKFFIKLEKLVTLFFKNPVTKALVNTAPALKELAILGKATSNHRGHGPKMKFDEVVIDAYATGHFLALLRAPKGISKVIKRGPMGEQSRSIHEVLQNPDIANYYLVTLSEDLPMQETTELFETLQDEFKIKAHLILNKYLPTKFTSQEFKAVKEVNEDGTFGQFFFDKLEQQEKAVTALKKLSDLSILKFGLMTDSKGWSTKLEASSAI